MECVLGCGASEGERGAGGRAARARKTVVEMSFMVVGGVFGSRRRWR